MPTKVNLHKTDKPRETQATETSSQRIQRDSQVSLRFSMGEGDRSLVSMARTCLRLQGTSGDPALGSS